MIAFVSDKQGKAKIKLHHWENWSTLNDVMIAFVSDKQSKAKIKLHHRENWSTLNGIMLRVSNSDSLPSYYSL
jgi:hypothetical protein